MAKIPEGILGVVIGSLGPVTGKRWKKQLTISSHRKKAKTDANPTPKQGNQRSKFGVASHFLGGSSDLVKITFKEISEERTEFQQAISYNIHNAVSGVKPDFILHYDLVAVGRGSLPNAVRPEARAGDNKDEIRYTWADNTGIGLAAAGDIAVAVAYCPEDHLWNWCPVGSATRADGSILMTIPAFGGEKVHTWLVFVTAEGKSSDSVYTGEVQVK